MPVLAHFPIALKTSTTLCKDNLCLSQSYLSIVNERLSTMPTTDPRLRGGHWWRLFCRYGAVGARLIHASAHVRIVGGVLLNSSPLRVTWLLAMSVAISHRLGEQGFAHTVLSTAKFWHYLQQSSLSSLVSFHAS